MGGGQIDHADNTLSTGNTHAGLDTVGCSTVDGHQVVGAVQFVVDHFGGYELILAQRVQLLFLAVADVLRLVGIQPAQLRHLAFQIVVAERQVAVDFLQLKE